MRTAIWERKCIAPEQMRPASGEGHTSIVESNLKLNDINATHVATGNFP